MHVQYLLVFLSQTVYHTTLNTFVKTMLILYNKFSIFMVLEVVEISKTLRTSAE